MILRNILSIRVRNAGGFIGEVTLILLCVQLLGVAFALYDHDLRIAGRMMLVWLAFAIGWSLAFLRRVPQSAPVSAIRREGVDLAKQLIVQKLARGTLPDVNDALATLAAARTEQGAADVIWNSLATAAAQGNVSWCREFVVRVPTDAPRVVTLGMYLALRPVKDRLPDLYLALAQRCGKA